MTCNQNCRQGRSCQCQQAGPASEGEPFAAEMTALFIIICCVFFVGFYIGRVTA